METSADDLRKRGVAIARTKAGFELPVIDVTNPRFTVADDAESIQALRDAVVASERQRRHIPKFIIRWMMKSAAKRSLLIRAVFQNDSKFLDSVSTYVMKLGADNLLAPYDSEIDKKFACSPHSTLMRLRMQQMAKLIAASVERELSAAPTGPLHLIDIGGGPAMDALNALILLAQSSSRELLKRPIVIQVLDLDDDGAFFGRAALAELMREGGRLHGLSVDFQHEKYDWHVPSVLAELLEKVRSQNAVVVAASEGGLFEYASDEDVVANLRALRAGGARCVVGSVTCNDDLRRGMIAVSPIKLVPRGIEGIRPLAAQAGFEIGQTRHAVWSDQVEFLAVG